MHSPKFPGKSVHLRKIVAASKLRTLWKNTVRDHMRRQLVPDAVEFLDFHIHLKQRSNELENAICSGEYQPRRTTRMRLEKSRGLCRQIVLPSPEDALILQALSNSLWDEISSKAPSKNAFYAPKDQPFSKTNIDPGEDDWGYGPLEAWLDFQQSILSFSKHHPYIVVTDIANYYDFILHGFLRAILAEYAQEKEHALDLLLYMLDSMLWRPDYMPNYGIVLPQMDQDAPRLLAHTHLFEVDEIFSKDSTINYARYMDDIDFGVDSIAKAKSVLRDLDLTLQTRNLRLNSGKTKILTAADALIHFRAEDNAILDNVLKRIKANGFLSQRLNIYRKLVSRFIHSGITTGRFDGGNGEKILKRLLTLATMTKTQIDDDSFRHIIYSRPALRQTVLNLWSRSPDPTDKLKAVSGYLRSGEAVDDVSKVQIALAFVDAQHASTVSIIDLKFLVESFDREAPFELFARLWLLSRFYSPVELKAEIDATNRIWSRHPFLARTVAGFYGLFRGTPHFPSFEAFVRKWGGPEAIALLDFHETLATTPAIYQAVDVFIKAGNPSMANKITHAKTLMFATMLSNPTIGKLQKAKRLGGCGDMMTDIYYRRHFSNVMSGLP